MIIALFFFGLVFSPSEIKEYLCLGPEKLKLNPTISIIAETSKVFLGQKRQV